MVRDQLLGVFVRPAYPQNEGLMPVFDNLSQMGTTAICTTPTVSRPATGDSGKRFPDLHVDGMWIQMYGYLSDAKMKIVRDMWWG